MSNLSDKEIDRLSREAADSYEPDHSGLSWSRLEQMLTEQMPERPPDVFRFSRISPYVWGPAVVLIAGISFYIIKSKFDSSKSTPSAQIENISGVTDASANAVANEDVKRSLDNRLKQENAVNRETADTKSANASDAVPDKLASSGNAVYSGGDNNQAGKSGSSSAFGTTGKSNREISSGSDFSSDIDNGSSVDGSLGAVVGLSAAATGRSMAAATSLPELASGKQGPGKISGTDSLLSESVSTGFSLKSKSLRINRSFNFGFAFGPDYTDAGGISNNQFGNNIGITVGYYLTDKISINSGIFYSNKFFWSPGSPTYTSQYIANRNVIYSAPAAQYINGSYNLYEIPLTLRYDFAAVRKSKFFVNAGLSSYFIVNQTYIHFFHNGNTPLAWKITDNSQENHWFSIGDLSVGMETDIGKGFSFQAEPFLKIPFKPMGMENSKPVSYGFLLSFRYAPVLGKTKK